jgi:hypothetical protein
MKNRSRIRWGAFALALSAALFTVWGLLHPVSSIDLSNPTAASRSAVSTIQFIADLSLLAAFTVLPLGLLTIYDRVKATQVERWGFVALVLMLLAVGPFLAGLGVALLAVPAAGEVVLRGGQGGQGGVDVLKAIFGGPLLPVTLVSIVLLTIGSITLAIALWRARSLPRWAGLMYALGFAAVILLPVVANQDSAQKMYRVLDGLLVGVGGLWLAWSIWREPVRQAAPGQAETMLERGHIDRPQAAGTGGSRP